MINCNWVYCENHLCFLPCVTCTIISSNTRLPTATPNTIIKIELFIAISFTGNRIFPWMYTCFLSFAIQTSYHLLRLVVSSAIHLQAVRHRLAQAKKWTTVNVKKIGFLFRYIRFNTNVRLSVKKYCCHFQQPYIWWHEQRRRRLRRSSSNRK